MSGKPEAFTTSGRYTRRPAHDRRTANGDDFAGDAWSEPSGVLFWTAVGVTPHGHTFTFTPCERCAGTGRTSRTLGDSIVPDVRCPACHGIGWTKRTATQEENSPADAELRAPFSED